HLFIDVTHRYHLDGRHLDQTEQVALAIPPRTDDADTLRLLVRHLFRQGLGGKAQAGGTSTQEFAAIHSCFSSPLASLVQTRADVKVGPTIAFCRLSGSRASASHDGVEKPPAGPASEIGRAHA